MRNIHNNEISDDNTKIQFENIENNCKKIKTEKLENNSKLKIENSDREKNNDNLIDISNESNSDIKIKNLDKSFTLIIHDLNLNKEYNAFNLKIKDLYYTLNLGIQIFCGSKEYTKCRNLEIQSTKIPTHNEIEKTITFDLSYKTLPMFASIVIKIKVILFNKYAEVVKVENVYWSNFKLFDHNRRLKTGK